jgi:hypothetical protein
MLTHNNCIVHSMYVNEFIELKLSFFSLVKSTDGVEKKKLLPQTNNEEKNLFKQYNRMEKISLNSQ